MNKKILVILIIVIVMILIGSFLFFNKAKAPINNNNQKIEVTPQQQPTSNQPEVKVEHPEVKAQGSLGGGILTICELKCGDGICETEQNVCKNGVPCGVCAETKADCPQDCK